MGTSQSLQRIARSSWQNTNPRFSCNSQRPQNSFSSKIVSFHQNSHRFTEIIPNIYEKGSKREPGRCRRRGAKGRKRMRRRTTAGGGRSGGACRRACWRGGPGGRRAHRAPPRRRSRTPPPPPFRTRRTVPSFLSPILSLVGRRRTCECVDGAKKEVEESREEVGVWGRELAGGIINLILGVE